MTRTQRIVVCALLACLLLALQGIVSLHATEHVSHQVHHGADAHSTVLCSWMCAAGQVIDGVPATSIIERSPVARIEPLTPRTIPFIAARTVPTRGPPVPFVLY